jgi:hypothetical protein
MIQDLPPEIQNKIFYYYSEHPTAKLINQEIDNLFKDYKNRYYRYFTVDKILLDTFRSFFSEYYFSKPSIQFSYGTKFRSSEYFNEIYTSKFNPCNCSCCKIVYL